MAADITPSQTVDELRSMVLNLNPEEIGLTQESYPHPVFGLVMETGFADGSFTLSVLADGTTSLYFSTGGGIIGAGEHESVRKASGRLLSTAQEFHSKAKKVNTFPKPGQGEVIFYFLTFDGVLSYTALENDLGNEKDELSGLFFAAHNVLSEIRKIEEKKSDK
jgi:hypothetical protein